MIKSPDYALRIPLRIFNLVPEEKRRLGLIVFLIALVHLFLFFILEIHYPTSQSNAHSRSEVFLSSPLLMGHESWQSTLFWNQMRDPSTLLRQTLIAIEKNKRLEPVFESTANSNLPLLAIGGTVETLGDEMKSLEEKAIEKMVSAPRPFIHDPELFHLHHLTRVVCSKNLEGRKAPLDREWPRPQVNLLNESKPTTLRIGISPEGLVLHALVEESSGSAAVDQIAIFEIRKMAFQSDSSSSLEWGMVTFFWAFTSPPPSVKEGP